MRKGIKALALAFIIIMLFILVYHTLFGSSPSPANGAAMNQSEEAPFWLSILVSWLPMFVVIIFYILFFKIFKKLLKVGDRIAFALEKISSNQNDIVNKQ